MDGPGDGRCDIRSIDATGSAFITQCKFLSDTNRSVSARQVDEIVIALHKFGAKSGLFATTGRLSAQAKREYLDYYEGLNLSFLEGQQIIGELESDATLREFWVSGKSIGLGAEILQIPYLLRDIMNDRPVDANLEALDLGNGLHGELCEDTVALALFEPYRPPTLKAFLDGYGDEVSCPSVMISGLFGLETGQAIYERSIGRLAARISRCDDKTRAIRFGRGRLLSSTGAVLATVGNPQTFILSNHSDPASEQGWTTPSQQSQWQFHPYVQSKNASEARWYKNPDDILLGIHVESPPGPDVQPWLEATRDVRRTLVNESLFLLGSSEKCKALLGLTSPAKNPDYVLDVGSDERLLCWWAPSLMDAWIEIPVAGVVARTKSTSACRIDAESEEQRGRLELARKLGLKRLDGTTATHLLAANGVVFPHDNTRFFYGSADLALRFSEIPSPINQRKRTFFFEAVWNLKDERAVIIRTLERAVTLREKEELEVWATNAPDDGMHLCGILLTVRPDSIDSADGILSRLDTRPTKVIQAFEDVLCSQFPRAERINRLHWERHRGLLFDLSQRID